MVLNIFNLVISIICDDPSLHIVFLLVYIGISILNHCFSLNTSCMLNSEKLHSGKDFVPSRTPSLRLSVEY